jgi:tellurium resistance protein TerD
MDFSKLESMKPAGSMDFSKAVVLAPGQRVNITEDFPDMHNLRVELYWETKHDGDLAALIQDEDGNGLPNGMCYYSQPKEYGLSYGGDTRSSTDGDKSKPEEIMSISLDELDPKAKRISLIASTFPLEDDLDQKAVPFGVLRECKVLVVNADTEEVIFGYELEEDFSEFTSVILCEMYVRNGSFRMVNRSEGFGKKAVPLEEIAEHYKLI